MRLTEILSPLKTLTIYKTFVHVVQSSYGFVGRFSITNLSRWTFGKGGSLRTLERFFADSHDWNRYLMMILAPFLKKMAGKFVLAVDQTTGKKSGKSTFGKGRHYDSKSKQVIPSISVLCISLIHTESKTSFPVAIQQLVYNQSNKKPKKPIEAEKRKVGRPKGSKNKPKKVAYTFEIFAQLMEKWQKLTTELCDFLTVKHVLADNGFGNEAVRKICQDKGLALISKLKKNSVLFFPNTSSYKTKPKKYGEKLSIEEIDESFLVEQTENEEEKSIQKIYRLPKIWDKHTKVPLNVVIIKEYLDKKEGWCILFSTDLNLSAQEIISLYQLRFQIEFDFRDARQHFGLTNFCNFKENQVTNVIGNAFFMVCVSRIFAFNERLEKPATKFSIYNLKSRFRGDKYLFEIKNMIENDPNLFFSLQDSHQLDFIGAFYD